MRDYTYKPGPVTPVSKYHKLSTIRIVRISSTCTLNLVYMADILCRICSVSYIRSTHLFMAILDYYIYQLLQYKLNTGIRVRMPGDIRVRMPGGIRYTLGRFVIVSHCHAYKYNSGPDGRHLQREGSADPQPI